MILFLSYFGLSIMGLTLPPLVAAGLSMTIYVSAYLGEIWRGSIQSVARTQWEAAECLDNLHHETDGGRRGNAHLWALWSWYEPAN